MPPSVDDWLPERHLARFVVEVVESLNLRSMTGGYRGSGSASYHPSMLLALLMYGYATGVFSSRKLERATYNSVAFRFIAGNDHPDHDTIATFRKRFLKEIEALFVRVLMLAKEMGVLQMGTVALDGTKIHANASRHSALSHEYAGKLEAQLKQEVAELLAKAEVADAADLPDGLSIPEELALREGRLKKLADGGRGQRPAAEDAGGAKALCASQTDAGAGVRDHQIGNGVPTVFPARPRQRARRVESRDDVMEHKETIHSEDRLNGRKSLVPPPKRSAHGVKSAFEVEVRIREAPFRRPGTSKNRLPHLQRKTQSDRLLAPS